MRTRMPIMENSTTVAYVPWSIFNAHDEEWADRNHGQSLDTLASRGGLGICELVAILEHRRWRKMELSEGWSALWTIAFARFNSPSN